MKTAFEIDNSNYIKETKKVTFEIDSDQKTGKVTKATIRVYVPVDYPNFGKLIDIACCYNADFSYKDDAFVVEVCNKELTWEICKDYCMFL